MDPSERPIIVRVADAASRHVVETAADYAAAFGALLVCAAITPDRYGMGDAPAGVIGMTRAIAAQDPPMSMSAPLTAMIDDVLQARGIA